MSTDLDVIKQLEQTIGKKLERLDKIDWNSIGYVQNEHNQITKLRLDKCGLKKLSPKIGRLQNLAELYLSGNQLNNLPLEIVKLQKLTILYLDANRLRNLSLEIGKLQNLTVLHLNNNKLNNLPPEIGKLQNLTELYLSENQLSNLPPEIVKLQNLTTLSLYNNQLNQFTKVLLDLNLEVKWDDISWKNGIYVKNNPFQTPPVEIIKQGRQAIVDYYNALKDNKQNIEQKKPVIPITAIKSTKKTQLKIAKPNIIKHSSIKLLKKSQPKIIQSTKPRPLNESKLILIGDGGAGKTSIVKRLLKQDFNPQESQTHGININTLTINDIKLHCWDFGGQQIMHATHQFFLSKRSLYLLVLDSRRETQVDYWLKHIQTFGHNAPVIIIINKIDENPHFDLPQRQLKQNYPNLKHICRISCATQQGIDQLNQTIQSTLPDIELLNTMFPAKWFNVKWFNVKTAITEQAKTTAIPTLNRHK